MKNKKQIINRKEKNQGMNWIRQEKRLAIYLRDGLSCIYCGANVEDGVKLSLDHIKPHSKGGSNSEKNLITSCLKCNSSRGNRPVKEFVNAVSEYINHGVTPEGILKDIKNHTQRSLKRFKNEAKILISRRGSAAKALASL